jgi:hypothetical protein
MPRRVSDQRGLFGSEGLNARSGQRTLSIRNAMKRCCSACTWDALVQAEPQLSYWRTPTKIAGFCWLAMLPRTSALPSALMAPLYTSVSESVSVNVPSPATV